MSPAFIMVDTAKKIEKDCRAQSHFMRPRLALRAFRLTLHYQMHPHGDNSGTFTENERPLEDDGIILSRNIRSEASLLTYRDLFRQARADSVLVT